MAKKRAERVRGVRVSASVTEVTLKTADAFPIVQRCARFARKKVGYGPPVLSFVQCTGDRLIATDLEIGIVYELPERWPPFVVPAMLLEKALAACGDEAAIRATPAGIVVEGARGFRWRAPSLAQEDCPALSTMPEMQLLPAGRGSAWVGTAWAMSSDSTRPSLCASCDTGARVYGTDGHVIVAQDVEPFAWPEGCLLLPRALVAALDAGVEPQAAGANGALIVLDYGAWRVWGRGIDAAPVDFERVLRGLALQPGAPMRTYDPAAAWEVLQRLGAFVTDESPAVRVMFDGPMIRFAVGGETDGAVAELAAEGGGDEEVCLNLRYAQEAFSRTPYAGMGLDEQGKRMEFRDAATRLVCLVMGFVDRA